MRRLYDCLSPPLRTTVSVICISKPGQRHALSPDPLAGQRLLPDLGPEHPDRTMAGELRRGQRGAADLRSRVQL